MKIKHSSVCLNQLNIELFYLVFGKTNPHWYYLTTLRPYLIEFAQYGLSV